MTGCYNPIILTSGGVEQLPSRCAHGADNNETISFDPKQIASANNESRSSIIHKLPLVNDYQIAPQMYDRFRRALILSGSYTI